MGRVIDETGNRYGRLTVVRRNPENAYHKGANWICRCECGGERVASGIGLRQGLIKSCGCLIRETRVLRCACGYKGQKTRDWTPDWKCYRCSGLSPLQEPPKMTEDELFEKRAEHWRYYHRSAPTSASHDVMLFLERLEKVTKERDMAIEQHRLSQHEVARWVDRETKAVRERDEWRDKFLALNQTAGELCNACGWAFRIPGESCRCEVVKERDEARAELALAKSLHDVAVNQRDGNAYLLAQVTRERDEALARCETLRALTDAAAYEQGLAQRRMMEAQRARDEARAEATHRLDELNMARAYRRGAEAMREACTDWVENWENDGVRIGAALRDLPIPEEP